MSRSALVSMLLLLAACGRADTPPARTVRQRTQAGEPAVVALGSSNFAEARRAADAALGADPRSARAAAVRALAAYEAAGHDLIVALTTVMDAAGGLKSFGHPAARKAWSAFAAALEGVDKDLATVAADSDFSLELCLACWERDWNRNGEIDDRDRKMFELEFDGKGGELPEGDPRRRPTIRFDVGDAEWARAMIAFQRAAVELVLAYRWSELDRLFTMFMGDGGDRTLVIHLADAGRVKRARQLVLAGLRHADACRAAYLAETDDDREWVPNPHQHSYAMPLEVDAALYDTWHGVLGDVGRMLESKEAISLRDAMHLVDVGTRVEVPDVYIDVGRMLREPKDIVFDLASLDDGSRSYERFLRGVLGNGYQTRMRPSPLVSRMRAMKTQLDRGEDSLGRKLRYLLWLN